MIQKAPFTGHHVNLGARTGSSPKSQEWFKPPHPAGTSTWVLNLQTLPEGNLIMPGPPRECAKASRVPAPGRGFHVSPVYKQLPRARSRLWPPCESSIYNRLWSARSRSGPPRESSTYQCFRTARSMQDFPDEHSLLFPWLRPQISPTTHKDYIPKNRKCESDVQSCPCFGTLKSRACPWVWMDVEGRKRMVGFYLVLSWLCAILASLAKPSFNLQYKSCKLGVR